MPSRPPRAKIARVPGGQPAPAPRASASKRGYSAAWEKARKGFLAKHPRCECPEHAGKPDAPRATVVDHHKPHKGDKALFWDSSNWRALAASCHSRKTASEDGGFGNRRRSAGRDGRGGYAEKGVSNRHDRAMPTTYIPAGFDNGGFF